MRSILLFIFVVVCLFVLGDVAQACPTCKDGMQNDPAAQSLVRGYQWSIIFMMSMPFSILGGIGGYFYYLIRKARAEAANSPAHGNSPSVSNG